MVKFVIVILFAFSLIKISKDISLLSRYVVTLETKLRILEVQVKHIEEEG